MTPPFRADHVGGLLRPTYIRDDPKRAIREVAAKQEAIGLESVTDGEFSRQWWNPGPKFGGTEEQPPIPTVTGKLRRSKPIMIEDFRFLASVTKKTPKFTIPSPSPISAIRRSAKRAARMATIPPRCRRPMRAPSRARSTAGPRA